MWSRGSLASFIILAILCSFSSEVTAGSANAPVPFIVSGELFGQTGEDCPGAGKDTVCREDDSRDSQKRPDRTQRPIETPTWALWDAEGQHLSTDEILTIHRDYGANFYFFRSESKQDLDLSQLGKANMTLVKVAHPGYTPFNQPDFVKSETQVREWAREAAGNRYVDGLALDMEGPTATTHKNLMRILAEEARAQGKAFHAVPHFTIFDRWEDTPTPEDFNECADIVWPWLYNRFRQPSYSQGLITMIEYWREKGVTVPVYPIFDHGRTSYSGITPSEARNVPLDLSEAGVNAVCLFQPHASYREQAETVDYGALWENLAVSYGGKETPAGQSSKN